MILRFITRKLLELQVYLVKRKRDKEGNYIMRQAYIEIIKGYERSIFLMESFD